MLHCPAQEDLEAFARNESGCPGIANHVASCPACRDHVAALFEDTAAENELRLSLASAVSPEIRQRLGLVCRRAKKDADMS